MRTIEKKASDEKGPESTKYLRWRRLAHWMASVWLAVAISASAEDDHRVQFHAQGGTLDEVTKNESEVVLVSEDPITKAEAIAALDKLAEKLRNLKNPKVTKFDIDVALKLIPKMKDWVNANGPGGIATGKSHSVEKGKLRVDCEPIRGLVLVDNLPHAFKISAAGWNKEKTRTWKNDKCPGRNIGLEEFEALKSDMFKEWGLDPKKTSDPRVRVALAAWKDAREWFLNVVLRDGLQEDEDSKKKAIKKKVLEVGQQAEIEFEVDVKVLNGVAFKEEN